MSQFYKEQDYVYEHILNISFDSAGLPANLLTIVNCSSNFCSLLINEKKNTAKIITSSMGPQSFLNSGHYFVHSGI